MFLHNMKGDTTTVKRKTETTEKYEKKQGDCITNIPTFIFSSLKFYKSQKVKLVSTTT